MTSNEQVNSKIAEIMGWEYDGSGAFIEYEAHIAPGHFTLEYWPAVKAMQARMRQDGWKITITDCDGGFYANAYRENESGCSEHFTAPRIGYSKTEPAALHALFCKVYNIGGEG